MKSPVSPHMVAALVLGMIAPLSAQNSSSTSPRPQISDKSDSIAGNPAHHRKVAVRTGPQRYEIETDSMHKGLARMSAVYREASKRANRAKAASNVAPAARIPLPPPASNVNPG